MIVGSLVATVIVTSMTIRESTSFALAEADLSDRVRLEMPPALAKLEASYSRMTGRGHLRNQDDSESPLLAQFTFSLDGASKRWTSGKDDPFCNVYCVSPPLSFFVRRETASAPFSIRAYGEFDRISGSIRSVLEEHLGSPYSVKSVPLSRIFADPSCKLTGLAEEKRGEKSCIKINYIYKNPKITLGSGWVVVSPDESWGVREFECKFDDDAPGAYHSGRVEYAEMRDGVPIILRSDSTRHGESFHERETYDFEEIRTAPPPAEVFSMSYYGLPEVGMRGRDRSAGDASPWFFGIALGLLGLAILARYGARRLERRRDG